ncbi:MAG: hypothetical protein HYV46_18425 [candidate division NC10 bacterium]|nr:hypothetical protein [candidate division NC10 bacterium]
MLARLPRTSLLRGGVAQEPESQQVVGRQLQDATELPLRFFECPLLQKGPSQNHPAADVGGMRDQAIAADPDGLIQQALFAVGVGKLGEDP